MLNRVALLTGSKLKRLFIVGGANQNAFLNRLTAEATVWRSSADRPKAPRSATSPCSSRPRRRPRRCHRGQRGSRRPWAGLFIEALDQASAASKHLAKFSKDTDFSTGHMDHPMTRSASASPAPGSIGNDCKENRGEAALVGQFRERFRHSSMENKRLFRVSPPSKRLEGKMAPVNSLH